MYDEDFADSSYYDEIVEQASKEAVASFTFERLRSFYDKERTIAEKPFDALAEARRLLQTPHNTAAFIHAAIASEVMLRGVVLKPILLGFIHSDSIAPFIVELAISSSGLQKFGKLLAKVFEEVSQLDLMTYVREGGTKALWQETIEVQRRRDQIMHRADTASRDEAQQAIAVATAVTEELFPSFARSLGYHLHDGFRLCSEWICSQPENIRKMLEQTQGTIAPKPGPSIRTKT
jgi:hypothetical protein